MNSNDTCYASRKIGMLAVLLVPAFALCQGYERSEVVAVDSASPSELYRRAERWFVDAFSDAQEVVQLRDTVTKTIVGKGRAALPYVVGSGMYTASGTTWFDYSVEVSCKEGRYRLRIYDAAFGANPVAFTDTCYVAVAYTSGPMKTRGYPVEMRDQLCAGAMRTVQGLSASLRDAMLTKQKEW